MNTMRISGTRSSALWGKTAGRRTRILVLALVVCAGIAGSATSHAKPLRGDASWNHPASSAAWANPNLGLASWH